MTAVSESRVTSLDAVPGWFHPVDQMLFTWFLNRQAERGEPGDLLEMGAYLGKSAILTGRHLGEGEMFTVCDLFGMPAPTEANRKTARFYTENLTRAAFESNYLAFHDTLPRVIQSPTSVILEHVAVGSCRFVHVDAAHLYDCVREDITAARQVLRPGGIVVFDDYRSEHTPGVAAAVWEAVFEGGLRPICVTPMKLYATWGDPEPLQEALRADLAGTPAAWWHEVQDVAGQPLIRVKQVTVKKAPAKNAELLRVKRELSQAEQALAQKKRRLSALSGSASYRIGRAVTALPRAARRALSTMTGKR